ncbi:VanZ family protein [Oceanobacillus saliphilus]|uniref:VanZ family protein n=1 Tax=Oceanobacillus saliphilus TaxID=2925834 RepID=UPI00201D8CD0|nr:VanZ family protein [Oceanobacillus saliphilus]
MKQYLYWLLPIGWMAMIFYSSATPYENQDIKPLLGAFTDLSFLEPFLGWIELTYNQSIVSVDQLGIYGFIEFFIRKAAHVFVFFVLACLFYISFRKTTKIREAFILLSSFLLTVFYAVSDELHQVTTPNRTAYVGDVFLDSFGALIAIVCIMIIKRR